MLDVIYFGFENRPTLSCPVTSLWFLCICPHSQIADLAIKALSAGLRGKTEVYGDHDGAMPGIAI